MSTGEPDYYRILSISRDAPDREVKRAYYELARKLHPDKAKSPEEASKNANDLALISKAYNTLKDPGKRAEYDQRLKGQPAGSGPAPGAMRTAAAAAPASAAPASTPTSSSAETTNASGEIAVPQAPEQQQQGAHSHQAMLNQRRQMAQKAFVKGMQLYKKQELKQALSFFSAAVENDPDSEAQYHLKYAQCLMKMRGSFTKAVEHAEKACQMDPYNLEFKLVLAEINDTAGASSRAREIYEEILRWDKENEQAKMRLSLMDASSESKSVFAKLLPSLFNKKKK